MPLQIVKQSFEAQIIAHEEELNQAAEVSENAYLDHWREELERFEVRRRHLAQQKIERTRIVRGEKPLGVVR